MTTLNESARRGTAMPRAATLAVLLAALALSGCSRGHVGESWQCPLATGGSCGSVAAVDPAVPDAGHGPVLDAQLWRKRDGAGDLPEAAVCAGGCGNGSGPFGWLGRLLRGEDSEGRDSARDTESGFQGESPHGVTSAPLAPGDSLDDGPARSALPADPALALHDTDEEVPDGDGPHGDGLRTDEVVARIWIAPFVDGNGVYREAGHVRVVLEPASWRTE